MEKEKMKFDELNLSDNVKKALKEYEYIDTTDIQEKTIPYILEGKDIIGQSQTGTGKTAAYGLPIIQKIDKTSKEIQSIVLCPTRELAVQVTEELRKFLKYDDNIKCLAVYGGQAIERQIMAIKKGVQIIIGTPGRVMDHMRRKTIKLNHVKIVVLDEADEMLNMGFEEDIETILKDVPENRQTVLFSATMNKRIMGITKKYLKEPKNVKIKAQELTVENIEQVSLEVKGKMKDETVFRLIDVIDPKKAIVFCNTKKKVDDIIESLKAKGYKAEALHGDIKQIQRDRIMKGLKSGRIKVLVATDVAARGIDVKDLELVINYDIPQEQEYYVHRIGRTGRNGMSGVAYTLYTGKEKYKLRDIERYANTKIKQGKMPTLEQVQKIKDKKIINRIQEVIDKNEFENTAIIESLLNENNDINTIAKALLTIIIGNKKVKKETKDFSSDENGNVRLFVNVGKKDKIMVKDIVGSFAANAVISGEDIGRVNLLDKFSFVDIPAEHVNDVLIGMQGKQIKGRNVNIEIANT
ncbi:MAG: DEAD/DEAH box helicase [Clostridia bacterium]|nr:DEAD/DEAH box helicase [Clostridia bacterium]